MATTARSLAQAYANSHAIPPEQLAQEIAATSSRHLLTAAVTPGQTASAIREAAEAVKNWYPKALRWAAMHADGFEMPLPLPPAGTCGHLSEHRVNPPAVATAKVQDGVLSLCVDATLQLMVYADERGSAQSIEAGQLVQSLQRMVLPEDLPGLVIQAAPKQVGSHAMNLTISIDIKLPQELIPESPEQLETDSVDRR